MKRTFLLFAVLVILFSCKPGNSPEDKPAWKTWAEEPPMGWNSYDAYHGAITETQFKACVDVLAKEMVPFGWEYAVVDFGWYRPADDAWYKNKWEPFNLAQSRDENGVLVPQLVMDKYGRLLPETKRWPSAENGKGFKAIGDYVHSKGMKFGIHIMRGIPRQAVEAKTPVMGTDKTADQIAEQNNTCPWMNHMYSVDFRKEGAQAYYNSIFKLYAKWGVDLVKADDMMEPPYMRGEIEMMHKAIINSGRPMVLSLSCGEAPVSLAYHLERNANMYRISGDLWDNWEDMMRMFDLAEIWSPFIGDGTWPNADMIPIGKLCLSGFPNVNGDESSPKREHDSFLNEEEHRSLMSLLCIIRSPLIWGGDPLTSTPWSKSFLKNKEIIEVNKHSSDNRQIYRRGNKRVWLADIPGSDAKYLGLFNTSDHPQKVTFDFYWELLEGKHVIRDLWNQEDIGIFEGRFEPMLKAHEGRLYKLTPVVE